MEIQSSRVREAKKKILRLKRLDSIFIFKYSPEILHPIHNYYTYQTGEKSDPGKNKSECKHAIQRPAEKKSQETSRGSQRERG